MKRIFKLASILGLGGLVAGCNSFLDKEPDNRASIDNLDKVSALLVSAYPNRTNMSLLDPRCDYIVDMGATSNTGRPFTRPFRRPTMRWRLSRRFLPPSRRTQASSAPKP